MICAFDGFIPVVHERAFVLEPLAELDPALVVPGLGAAGAGLATARYVRQLRRRLAELSPDVVHKTEIGGVVTDVRTSNEAREAFDSLLMRAETLVPEARVDGVLVSEFEVPFRDGALDLTGVAYIEHISLYP